MAEHAEVQWRYRQNRDSEFAETESEDLTLLAQDCDGDFSYWHVKRGNKFLAAAEVRWRSGPYHFDIALERAVEVAKAILKAEHYNSMRDCPRCNGKPGHESCPQCHGFGFYVADRPSALEALG